MQSIVVTLFLILSLCPVTSVGSSASGLDNAGFLQAEDQPIQYKVHNEVTAELAYKVIGITVFLLVIVYTLLLVVKKYFPMQGIGIAHKNRIEICETRYLKRNTCVFLIKVDEKEYMLATHGNSISVVKHESHS